MEDKDVAMLSIDKLEIELNKLIKKEYNNLELKKTLNKVFADKGLNPSTVNLIMDEKKFINELNDYEKIAFSYGCFLAFDKRNKYLDPAQYFSSRVIKSYNDYTAIIEKQDIIELKNFQMKNDYEYYGLISYKQIYELMSNNLLAYDIDIQRSPSYKPLGGKTIKTATIDNEAVKNIEDCILEGKFEDTQIVLSLLTEEDGKRIKFNFDDIYENFGNIIISDTLKINDGMHRCLGICNAVVRHLQKTGQYLEGSISARLVICDKERAKRITVQSFKRSATNVDWLKGIDEENDTSKYVNKLIELSKTLKNNVGITYDEAKALNKLTYKTLIIDLIKKLDIDVSNKSEVLFRSKKMANYLDTLVDLLKDYNFNNDNHVFEMNMFVAYIYFAYEMSNKKNEDIELYEKMIEKVLNMKKEDRKNLKIGLKNYSINNIINYFKDVFEVREDV